MSSQSTTIDEIITMVGEDVLINFLTVVQNNTTDSATLAAIEGYLADLTKTKVTVTPEQQAEMLSKIKVGITDTFSMASFKNYYPNISLIKNVADVANYDLIIVPGGADIDPAIYGEVNKASDISKVRDDTEVPLVKEALRLRKKLFGVCRGHQLINALKGCSIIQDLYGYGYKAHGNTHDLEWVVSSGLLYKYFNGKPVISMHHQAVLNANIKNVCLYGGVVEGCENNTIITTQFHPEFMEGTADFFAALKSWAFNIQ